MSRALLAALALSAASCTVPYYQPDDEVLGVEFDWGPQTQGRERADDLIVYAAEMLPDGRLLRGLRVKFVETADDAVRDCEWNDPRHPVIAGCWHTRVDLLILASSPRLEDTALLHEAFHRARFIAHGQAPGSEDYCHHDRDWWAPLAVSCTCRCPAP